MEKLRSVNLKLTFDICYDEKPLVIKYDGKQVDEVNLLIKSIDQKEQITFEGFVPNDTKQKVSCVLWHEGNKVSMIPISSLQMQNNQYVTNKKIENCTEVHFNGILNLAFCKQWFKHNILAGANLGEGFVNWDEINFTDDITASLRKILFVMLPPYPWKSLLYAVIPKHKFCFDIFKVFYENSKD